MSTSSYAVILGFDAYKDPGHLLPLKYAQKDARDLHAVLTDPSIGGWPASHVALITNDTVVLPDEHGVAAISAREGNGGCAAAGNLSTSEIETILYSHIVKNRTAEDTVLVYYSGHGYLAGDAAEPYLATPDVSIHDVLANPKAGLQMSYLYEHLFRKTPAKLVMFMLDCCHSGAFCPAIRGAESSSAKALVEDRYFVSEGRVAFVSSPKGVLSRESSIHRNGVFTSFVLQGLRGAAAESPTREVTLGSLVAYVQSRCPASQPPVFYGKTMRHVLCRPETDPHAPGVEPFLEFADLGRAGRAAGTSPAAHCVALANPLDDHLKYCDRILSEIRRNDSSDGGDVLCALERALNAELVFVCRIDDAFGARVVSSSRTNTGAESDRRVRRVLADTYGFLTGPKERLVAVRYGFSVERTGEDKVVGVPLRLDRPREFLFIVSDNDDCRRGGETLGRVIATLYAVTHEFTTFDAARIEAQLLDDLRRVFGHVPHSVYDRRFSLFKEHLGRIEFSFEPVIYLGRKQVEIDSWEALARDPATCRVPSGLFSAAQLWGPRFTTELDLECLRKAVHTFSDLWSRQRPGQKMDPLSVNVYPETLYRDAYKSEVRRLVLDEERIRSKRFVLEISEKQPLPNSGGWTDDRCVREFVDRLHDYTDELHIGFAIDDFGVGHSSVERLAKLELDHIKLDRDILHHPFPKITMKYVQDIVNSTHSHPHKIVVEGYDGESHLSLSELVAMDMWYVQGHLIRQAVASVEDLTEDEVRFLRQVMTATR